jgi:TPR repeat protein
MKFIALAFSCLLIFSMPANASEADSFNAMVVLANKGDAEAQYHVGMMHNNGIGTQKNPTQAFEWFQKSAASNDPLGAYKLGCYYDGQGAGIVTSDSNEALKYKLVSAKAGYALAQHDVAILYDRQGNAEEALKGGRRQAIRVIPALSIVYRCRIRQEKERQEIYRYRMRILNSQNWRPKKM